MAGKPDTTVSTSETLWFKWKFGVVSLAQIFTCWDVHIGISKFLGSSYLILIQVTHLVYCFCS